MILKGLVYGDSKISRRYPNCYLGSADTNYKPSNEMGTKHEWEKIRMIILRYILNAMKIIWSILSIYNSISITYDQKSLKNYILVDADHKDLDTLFYYYNMA